MEEKDRVCGECENRDKEKSICKIFLTSADENDYAGNCKWFEEKK